MNQLYILINAIVFGLLLVRYQKLKKTIDIGSLFYFIMAISAIGSCWYYSQDKVNIFYPDISLIGFSYLWITIAICLHPFETVHFNRIKKIEIGGIAVFLDILTVIFIVISIPPFISLLTHISFSSFGSNYLGRMYESEVDKASLYFSGFTKACFAMIRRFEDIIIVLFMYQLSKGKKNLQMCIGLFIPIFLFLLFKMFSGSRGGVMASFISIMSAVLLLKDTFSKQIFNYIKLGGAIFVSIAFVGVTYISMSRFTYSVENSQNSLDRWISQYLGEGMIRFNDTIWNLDKIMMGDQNFIWLKNVLGFDVQLDYNLLMNKYERFLGTPINVF